MANKKIKNKNYRNFLDNGIIEMLSEEDLIKALSNIEHKQKAQARALLICLYYTGARPVEILDLKAKDIKVNKSYLTIKVRGAKRGLPRTIYLRLKLPLVKELYDYSVSLFDEMYLFFDFKNHYSRKYKLKTGEIKEYIETTDKLRYHFNKWFYNVIDGSISPYYLRHNRFSKLSEAGLSMDELRMLKGAKTFDSVTPYLHLSTLVGKKIAKVNK